MKGVKGTITPRRVCACGSRKAYTAKACRACSPGSRHLLGRRGPDSPAWKGGRSIDRDGYVRLYAPDHPWPRRNGCVPEHVAVMELAMGRRIVPGEVVHHMDGDRRNNAISNLELMTRAEHSREHRLKDTWRRKRDHGRFA